MKGEDEFPYTISEHQAITDLGTVRAKAGSGFETLAERQTESADTAVS